jgi:UMF1 family MFS transporter
MAVVGLMVRRMLMPPFPTTEQAISVGQVASRWSMGSILILFIVGVVLFYFVDEEKGKEQAKFLAESI